MSPLHCPHCGAELESAAAELEPGADWRCPACGLDVRVRTGAAALAPEPEAGYPEAGGERAGFTTLFQPRILLDEPERRGARSRPGETQPLERPEAHPALPPPARGAYLLRVGAPAGGARLTVPSALTVLGRAEADIDLDDPSVSARHFQIEAIGAEFFVRDLGSRNGTYLNGTKVRYAELRPGDQLRAGRTVLVFRTEDDGV